MGQASTTNDLLSSYLKLLKMLVASGIPDTRWGSLLLYFREIKSYTHLTDEQKGKIQDLMTEAIASKNFTEAHLDELLEKYRQIISAPAMEQVATLAKEAEKMLEDFHGLTQARYDNIEHLETETVTLVEENTNPQDIITHLQQSFKKVKSKLKEDMASLEKLAFKDTLTNVGNRRAFDRFMDTVVPRWKEQGIPLSLAIFDVDFFKKFNDTYGHSVGDQVLKLVGKYLNQTVMQLEKRDNMALAARYGGEEFLLVVSGPEARQMADIADKLRREIRDFNFILRDDSGNVVQSGLQVTMSGGVVVCRADWENCQNLMVEHADKGLYQAKGNGRDRVYMYSPRADSGYRMVESKE